MSDTTERVTYKTLSEAIERMRLEIKSDIGDIDKQIGGLSKRIENNYVSKEEFLPVKKDVDALQSAVQWVVISVLGVVLIAILKLVIVE